MDAFEPSPEQIERLAAEFKERFGKGHTLHVVHNEGHNYIMQSSASGGLSTTMLNTIEPPVAEAIFRHGAAVAAQEHAVVTDPMRLKAVKITSAHLSMRGLIMAGPFDYNETFSGQLYMTILHTSAMTMHEHAAEYVGFEHARYSHLQDKNEHHVLRGVALLSRAYVESAAARHGVDVDVDRISKGIDLGRTDKRIVGAAKRALDEVHRQRLLGPDVDIVDATRELDEAFSRLRKAFCYE